jgi:hypothetical protein
MHVQTSRNPDKNEVSTIQHAMNKRFLDHPSFLSEIQNRPKTLVSQGSLVLTAGFIREKQTGIPQNVVSEQWTILSSFIDVQGEILFYGVLATDNDFNGQFIDYGTFPRVGTDYFRKNQTYGWKALSKLFKRRNPKELENVNRPRPPKSGYEAPLEARIYLALEMCCDDLLSRKFEIEDSNLGEASISAIAIDTKWGESSETVKRFIREYGDNRVKSYGGQSFGPGMRQLEEYEPRPGWLFEHQLHPHVKESKWCVKPYEKSKIKQNYIQADVSRLKSELMRRLATPLGSAQGCITLFNASPIRHKMFAEHLADSQFPEPTTARDVTKDIWKPKPGGVNDDDFLDVAAGCLAVASIQGASIKSKKHKKRKKTKQKTLRDMYNDRKQRTDGPAGRRPTK